MAGETDQFDSSGTVDERIRGIKKRFASAWVAGETRIEDFLTEVEEPHRRTLFAELLEAELRSLGDSAGPVQVDDYRKRFPGYLSIIEQMLASKPLTKADAEPVAQPDTHGASNAQITLTMSGSDAASAAEQTTDLPDKKGRGRPGQADASPRDVSKITPIDGYELISEIARGGMGVVYKARHVALNRIVALKMILAGQLANEQDVQRFRSEAEAAAALDHQNIVPVYDVGESNGQHYFSMGYIDGQSLSERVAEGPLPPVVASEVTRIVAGAIAYAHRRGVIHRDLKPANILLAFDEAASGPVAANNSGSRKDRGDYTSGAFSDGQLSFIPKVADFGLSKKIVDGETLTHTGQVLGTPAYMAPEQASGAVKEVSQSADIYSLGAVLYCLLTGRPPFQAASVMETLIQVTSAEPVSPRDINREVPRDLETICLKCLEKQPQKRYATAQDLADDLQRFANREPILARPVSRVEKVWRWCRRNPLLPSLASVASILLILGAVVSSLFAFEASRQASEADIQRNAALTKQAEAERSALAANKAREAVERSQARLEDLLYASHMNAIQLAFLDGDAGRMRELLDRHTPKPGKSDDRGFEWHYWNRLSHPYRAEVRADNSAVRAVAVLDGEAGRHLITAGQEGVLRLWSHPECKLIREFEGAGASVSKLSLSSDKMYVAGVTTKSVVVWNTGTGRIVCRYPTVDCRAVRFSGTESDLLLFGDSGSLKTARVPDPETVQAGEFGNFLVSIEFSPAGKTLAVGYRKLIPAKPGVFVVINELQIVNANSFTPIRKFSPAKGVDDLAWIANGWQIVTTGSGGQPSLYDLRTGAHRHLSATAGGKSSTGRLFTVAVSPSGVIAAAGEDRIIYTWHAATGKLSGVLRGHGGVIYGSAFEPGGELLTASGDATVKVWSLQKIPESRALPQMRLEIAVSNDSRYLAGCLGKGVQMFDIAAGNGVWENQRNIGYSYRRLDFTSDDNFIVGAHYNGTELVLLDSASGRILSTFPAPFGVQRIAAMSGSPLIAASSHEGSVAVWRLNSGDYSLSRKWLKKTHKGETPGLAVSPDDSRIAAAGVDGNIKILAVADGRVLHTIRSNSGAFRDVAFSPDGKYLAACCDDRNIRVWDATQWRLLHTLKGHGGIIRTIAFSPGSNTLASGSDDGTVRLWHVKTGEMMATFRGFNSLQRICFAADGQSLVAVDDIAGRLWRAGLKTEEDSRHSLTIFELAGANSYWTVRTELADDGWESPEYDDKDWTTVSLETLKAGNKTVQLRNSFFVHKPESVRDITLMLPRGIQADVFLNGAPAPISSQPTGANAADFIYHRVQPHELHRGENTLAVSIRSPSTTSLKGTTLFANQIYSTRARLRSGEDWQIVSAVNQLSAYGATNTFSNEIVALLDGPNDRLKQLMLHKAMDLPEINNSVVAALMRLLDSKDLSTRDQALNAVAALAGRSELMRQQLVERLARMSPKQEQTFFARLASGDMPLPRTAKKFIADHLKSRVEQSAPAEKPQRWRSLLEFEIEFKDWQAALPVVEQLLRVEPDDHSLMIRDVLIRQNLARWDEADQGLDKIAAQIESRSFTKRDAALLAKVFGDRAAVQAKKPGSSQRVADFWTAAADLALEADVSDAFALQCCTAARDWNVRVYQWDRALRFSSAIVRLVPSSINHFILGVIQATAGSDDLDSLLVAFKRRLSSDVDFFSRYTLLQSLTPRELTVTPDEIEAFDQLLEKSTKGGIQNYYLVSRALLAIRRGNYSSALKFVAKMTGPIPGYRGKFVRALALVYSGDKDASRRIFRTLSNPFETDLPALYGAHDQLIAGLLYHELETALHAKSVEGDALRTLHEVELSPTEKPLEADLVNNLLPLVHNPANDIGKRVLLLLMNRELAPQSIESLADAILSETLAEQVRIFRTMKVTSATGKHPVVDVLLERLEDRITENPADTKARTARMELWFTLDQPRKAKEDALALLKIDPDEAAYLAARIQADYILSDWAEVENNILPLIRQWKAGGDITGREQAIVEILQKRATLREAAGDREEVIASHWEYGARICMAARFNNQTTAKFCREASTRFACLGEWERAAEFALAEMETGLAYSTTVLRAAVLFSMTGQKEAFAALLKKGLSLYANGSISDLERLVKAGSVWTGAVDPATLPLEPVEQYLSKLRGNAASYWLSTAAALARLRLNDAQLAFDLTASMPARHGVLELRKAIHAIAAFRLGKVDYAKKLLSTVNTSFDLDIRSLSGVYTWQDILMPAAIRQQAEAELYPDGAGGSAWAAFHQIEISPLSKAEQSEHVSKMAPLFRMDEKFVSQRMASVLAPRLRLKEVQQSYLALLQELSPQQQTAALESLVNTFPPLEGEVATQIVASIDSMAKERSGDSGAAALKTTCLATLGAAGKALWFDGQSYVEFPGMSFSPSKPLTVEAWVAPESGKSTTAVVASNSNTSGFSLAAVTEGGKSVWQFQKGTARRPYTVRTLAQVSNRELVHVAGVYDGSEIRLYLNGVLQLRTPTATISESASGKTLVIGAQQRGTQHNMHFQGMIDEIHISQAARYDDNFTPQRKLKQDEDTLALYHCDTLRDGRLKDAGPRENHAVLQGARLVLARNLPALEVMLTSALSELESRPPATAEDYKKAIFRIYGIANQLTLNQQYDTSHIALSKLAELSELWGDLDRDENQRYNAACIQSLIAQNCILRKQSANVVSQHQKAALKLLKQAIDIGFSDVKLLQKDHDLKALRDLAEFKDLVRKLTSDAR